MDAEWQITMKTPRTRRLQEKKTLVECLEKLKGNTLIVIYENMNIPVAQIQQLEERMEHGRGWSRRLNRMKRNS